MHMRAAVPIAVGLAFASVDSLSGQDLAIREDEGTRRAQLTLSRVGTLSGERVLGAPISLVRRPTGGFYVTFYPTGNEILEFGEVGEFVRVLAPTGRGPGEVTAVRHLQVQPDGSLHAYDAGRVVVFDDAGQAVAAQPVSFPTPADIGSLAGGRLVVNAQHFAGGQAQPLHLIADGQIVRSFGADPQVSILPTTPHLHRRSIVAAADGRFWTAPLTKYEIQEWTSEGNLTRTLAREVEWFRAWQELRFPTPGSPPDPRLADLGRTREGDLLVILALPADGWEQYLGEPRPGPGGGVSYPDADFSKIFRARLEVVDADVARVVGFLDTDAAVSLVVDEEHVSAYREDALGNPFVDIYRLRVIRR